MPENRKPGKGKRPSGQVNKTTGDYPGRKKPEGDYPGRKKPKTKKIAVISEKIGEMPVGNKGSRRIVAKLKPKGDTILGKIDGVLKGNVSFVREYVTDRVLGKYSPEDKTREGGLAREDPLRVAMENGDFGQVKSRNDGGGWDYLDHALVDVRAVMREVMDERDILKNAVSEFEHSEVERRLIISEASGSITDIFGVLPRAVWGKYIKDIREETGVELFINDTGRVHFSDNFSNVYGAIKVLTAANNLIGTPFTQQMSEDLQKYLDASMQAKKERKTKKVLDETELSAIRRKFDEGIDPNELSAVRQKIQGDRMRELMDKARIRDDVENTLKTALKECMPTREESRDALTRAMEAAGDNEAKAIDTFFRMTELGIMRKMMANKNMSDYMVSYSDSLYDSGNLMMQVNLLREVVPDLEDVGIETILSDVVRKVKKMRDRSDSIENAGGRDAIRRLADLTHGMAKSMGIDGVRDFDGVMEICSGNEASAYRVIINSAEKLNTELGLYFSRSGLDPEYVKKLETRIRDLQEEADGTRFQRDRYVDFATELADQNRTRHRASDKFQNDNEQMGALYEGFQKKFGLPEGYVLSRVSEEVVASTESEFDLYAKERMVWLRSMAQLVGSVRNDEGLEYIKDGMVGILGEKNFRDYLNEKSVKAAGTERDFDSDPLIAADLSGYLEAEMNRCGHLILRFNKAEQRLNDYIDGLPGD